MVTNSHKHSVSTDFAHTPILSVTVQTSGPTIVVLTLILTLLTVLSPELALLAAGVPLLLLTTTKSCRPLLAACLVGNLLMLFGSTGEVEFLGYLTISPNTPAFAIAFSNLMAISIYALSRNDVGSSLSSSARLIPVAVHISLLCTAVALLLLRFTSGVPIFQGDEMI
jgi:hypothetical protein